MATCQTQQAYRPLPIHHQQPPPQPYMSSPPTSYQPNPSTCHINPSSTYHNPSNVNPYPYQSISQQPLSYASPPSSSHQHIKPQQHQSIQQFQPSHQHIHHQQQVISQQQVQTSSQPQQIPHQSYVSSPLTLYQPNPSTCHISPNVNPYPYQSISQQPLSYATPPQHHHNFQQIQPKSYVSPSPSHQPNLSTHHVNTISTYQHPPQHYPVHHSNIPTHHQTHPQGNQVSSQEAPLIDLSPPLQQEAHPSPNGPLYINQVNPSYPMQDLISFDKGDTNLANASYESPPPSNQMPTHEPTSPIPTPSCDPNPSPLVHQPSSPSSPCSINPSLKDSMEVLLEKLVQANLIELPLITPFGEIHYKPYWYKDNEYCHRCKGHAISTCAQFKILVKNLEDCGKIVLDKINLSNPIILPSNPNPSPSNPIIPQSNQNPNPKPTTPSTLIVHSLYFPSTHTLAKDVIQWLLARNRTPPLLQVWA